jgi:hypothetical protein
MSAARQRAIRRNKRAILVPGDSEATEKYQQHTQD